MLLQTTEKRGIPALALVCALSVAACGGGGGGDSSGGNTGSGGGTGGGGNTNSAPTISGAPPNSVNAGEAFSFTPTAADADGDTLTFSVSNPPPWAVFDPATGTLSGMPFAGDIGEYPDITISVSDGTVTTQLNPFGLTVAPQELGRANFTTEGDVFETDTGFQAVGTLVMDTGERVQEFDNADLLLEFDGVGNLVSASGVADLPVQLSENVTVSPGIRAVVGTLRGADINADPDFGIQLLDDTLYFVFYVGGNVSLTITNPADPSQVVVEDLEAPVGGQIVIISDLTDPFLYRYGAHPSKGAFGSGQSFNALIPFAPDLDYPGLDSFNGNTIEKGTMAMKLKGVEIGNFEGMRVTRDASFFDIDWNAPFDSPIEYRTGANGVADVSLSVPIVGDFNFAQAEFGATLDVGFDRQQAAFAMYIDAQATTSSPFVPAWFHLAPSGAFDGEGTVNGTGEFDLTLFGGFHSSVPPADVTGTMHIDNGSVSLGATTVQDGEALSVLLEFANQQTTGRVQFPDSYAQSITGDVSAALDREIAQVEQALQDLQAATADYEFEASLRGLRDVLPATMDAAVKVMNGIPDTVYDRAYDKAISVMQSYCTTVATKKVCLDDVVDEVSIATDIAKKAKSEAAAGIKDGVNAMNDLKARALQADDEQLREGLRLALDSAYKHRTFSIAIKITKSINVVPFGSKTLTLYDETYTKTVLSTADANKIALARDNVWRIQATSDIMIQAQQIYDQLPTTDVINQVKQGVQDGTQQVPVPEGLGYHAIGDTYDAFITVDGVDYVTDINVLKPSEVRTGVSDLLAGILLEPLK